MKCLNKIEYLSMKMHYFLFNAALAGLLPYLPVYAKQLGIAPVSAGLIFTVLPFVTMIAKPLVGAIADRTKKIKTILKELLLILCVSSLLMLLIPMKNSSIRSTIVCSVTGTVFMYDNELKTNCLNVPKNESFLCLLSCKECFQKEEINYTSSKIPELECNSGNTMNGELDLSHPYSNSTLFNVIRLSFDERSINVICSSKVYFSCNTTCNPIIHKCYEAEKTSDYLDVHYWLLFVLIIFCNVPASISGSLGDAACFNLLGENAHLYGYQRLWGTIGWGIFGAISGAFIYLATGSSFIRSYYPGFLLLTVLLLFDICAIHNVQMDNLILSKSIFKDVIKLLKKANILMFLCSVFITGLLTGVMWQYLFWHLDTLKASSLLLGGISTVQCLLGELPFLYFSGIILSKIGHFNTLTISFLAFGIRFVLYSYLKNPNWILLIEILQGPSLGLFFSTMPTYANIAALPGTEATMQGLAGGTFEGLGIAIGSFLGGIGMQKYGGGGMFLRGGILSLVYCIINILFTVTLHFQGTARKNRPIPKEMEDSPNEGTTFM